MRLSELPTTNIKVVVSLSLSILTAIRYMIGGWEPSSEWLLFLAGLASLDTAQHAIKRFTHKGTGSVSTDIKELSEKG